MDEGLIRAEKSLKEIIKQEVAETYVFDTCILGSYFTLGYGESINWNQNIARYRKVSNNELKRELIRSKTSLELLERYESIKSSRTVLEEFESKFGNLNFFSRRRKHARSNIRTKRFYQKGIMVKREKHIDSNKRENKLLSELIAQEERLKQFLAQRLIRYDSNFRSLEKFIEKNIYSQNQEEKNHNDEKIVIECLNLAISESKHVAIITKDHRFKSILLGIQKLFEENYETCENYAEMLKEPRLTIIRGNYEEGFYTDYCSADFRSTIKK